MPAARSLRSRALQLLAQRDQSQAELRRKLLAHVRESKRRASLQTPDGAAAPDRPVSNEGDSGEPPSHDGAAEVDAVLAWLEARRFLSDDRFAESRATARASRYGNVRIRLELARHDVALTPEAEQALVESELARAKAVRNRKFSALPSSAAERARQTRFLMARGFSGDVIRRLLRSAGENDAEDVGD